MVHKMHLKPCMPVLVHHKMGWCDPKCIRTRFIHFIQPISNYTLISRFSGNGTHDFGVASAVLYWSRMPVVFIILCARLCPARKDVIVVCRPLYRNMATKRPPLKRFISSGTWANIDEPTLMNR